MNFGMKKEEVQSAMQNLDYFLWTQYEIIANEEVSALFVSEKDLTKYATEINVKIDKAVVTITFFARVMKQLDLYPALLQPEAYQLFVFYEAWGKYKYKIPDDRNWLFLEKIEKLYQEVENEYEKNE